MGCERKRVKIREDDSIRVHAQISKPVERVSILKAHMLVSVRPSTVHLSQLVSEFGVL